MKADEFFCKVFLKTDLEKKKQLLEEISRLFNKEFNQFLFLENDLLSIEFRRNKEYDAERLLDKNEGFLFYPYFLEIDLKEEQDAIIYLTKIKEILRYLMTMNIDYVVACDFEEELSMNQM